MKQELLDWAAENSHVFPELDLLCEANVDSEIFINLPVQYGIYKEQYYYVDENRTANLKEARTVQELLYGGTSVEMLRGTGNSVAIIENYDAARTLILECVKELKKQRKSKNI